MLPIFQNNTRWIITLTTLEHNIICHCMHCWLLYTLTRMSMDWYRDWLSPQFSTSLVLVDLAPHAQQKTLQNTLLYPDMTQDTHPYLEGVHRREALNGARRSQPACHACIYERAWLIYTGGYRESSWSCEVKLSDNMSATKWLLLLFVIQYTSVRVCGWGVSW